MKKLFFIALCIAGFSLYGKSQTTNSGKETIKVILDNDKVKVTEFDSAPGGDACGKGKHSHKES